MWRNTYASVTTLYMNNYNIIELRKCVIWISKISKLKLFFMSKCSSVLRIFYNHFYKYFGLCAVWPHDDISFVVRSLDLCAEVGKPYFEEFNFCAALVTQILQILSHLYFYIFQKNLYSSASFELTIGD